ncbi:hypothetical protein ACTFFR_03030, partial [Campylobacter jejuni]
QLHTDLGYTGLGIQVIVILLVPESSRVALAARNEVKDVDYLPMAKPVSQLSTWESATTVLLS